MEVLVFSRTGEYRHESIPAGVRALGEILGDAGYGVRATEDVDAFTERGLAGYEAVVFCNTSGNVFGAEQRAAFAAYLRGGGGFVGVHCAAHTETGWAFYGDVVGARFTGHPAVQPATVVVVDRDHPATAHLPARWRRTDEWYDFAAPPHGVRVLLGVDESTYDGATMGGEHPIAWCHERIGRGRSFYTALGHTVESYAEPAVRAHLLGAITWAAGATPR